MNRILVPIDFSDPSIQAAKYANQFANEFGAEIDFLHVFSIPVSAVDSYVYVPSNEEIESIRNNHIAHLKEMAIDIDPIKLSNHKIKVYCLFGNPIDQILEFAKQYNDDLIILGLQGEGFLKERLLGSTATHLFKKSGIPVIAVHSNTNYSKFKNILFAYDTKPFTNKQVLKPLIEIANLFHSHIHVLNITDEVEEFPVLSKQILENQLEPTLDLKNTSYHIGENNDIIDGIKEYITENPMDLIVIISREHSAFTNIFEERISKKAAFHIELPILALNDN